MNLHLRKTLDRSKPNRRDFMVQTGCAGLGITSAVNTLAHLQLMGTAAAQNAGDDYKALVCIFLNGGMDTNNLLIPVAGTARTHYETGRGIPQYIDPTKGGVAIPMEDITTAGSQINPLNAVTEYEPSVGYLGADANGNRLAVHPGAMHIKTMFDAEDLAFITNVGVLTQPNVTRANFSSLPASQKPPQLFSHSDQQTQWQSSIPDRPFKNGWGGRVADILDGIHNTDPEALSMMVSINGFNSFQVGTTQQPYVMSASGVTSYSATWSGGSPSTPYGSALQTAFTSKKPFTAEYDPFKFPTTANSPYQNTSPGWRLAALEQLLGMSHASLFDEGYINVAKNARVTEGLIGGALNLTANGVTTTLDTHFDNAFAGSGINGLTNGFAQQMRMVARLIVGNSVLNNKRQIFFVQLGGWDTHTSQIPVSNGVARTDQSYYSLMLQLSCAMKGFRDSLQAAGLWNNVTSFTASDFTRTFTPNKTDSTGGSDHGWGGHMMVMGGAVRGKRIYGTFPNLTVNGGIDVQGNRGRWIPTSSVDQYAAVLARWFGVDTSQLGTVFPNLSRFINPFTPAGKLDFME
ncbi:DUF1501 domain-containing protein [Prosthecobacter dejongeii]|uniref:Uncharacterized protein (DUF1501 family) n=1 Tax=Prosthecobacter dejongeii TaxID=48465 RepID=A0A7W8DNG8_9BACT|nr:DUF1501 domain-containing protein [Prosthecobacter dejongeii]MBB5035901.1 uncharacterized protein (DUF1501 family) [Prosthecobacter dejongeii]